MFYWVFLWLKCVIVILSVYIMINCFLLFIYVVWMDCLVLFVWKNVFILFMVRIVKRYVNVILKFVIIKKDVQVYIIINQKYFVILQIEYNIRIIQYIVYQYIIINVELQYM